MKWPASFNSTGGLPTFEFTKTTVERQYGGDSRMGHGGQGHLPDYIVLRPDLFSQYVGSLAGALYEMRGGQGGDGINKGLLDALKSAPSTMATVFTHRFQHEGPQNAEEIRALLEAAGKHGVQYTSPYRPELGNERYNDKFPANKWGSWDSGAMNALIEKIKKGTPSCCPPSK